MVLREGAKQATAHKMPALFSDRAGKTLFFTLFGSETIGAILFFCIV